MDILSRGVSAFIHYLMLACYTLFSLKICTDLFATKMTIADFVCFIVIIILLICMALVCASKLRNKLLFILLIGFILRATVVLLVNTQPVSDFQTMYQAAEEVSFGNFNCFKGTNYLARFPHLTIMTLYMSVVRYVFGSASVAVMKIVNVLLGVLNIYLIYLIVLRVHCKKSALIAASLSCLYPAFIIYTGVLCSENIALTFYMLSIIKFYDFDQNKRLTDLVLCGICISFGDLFRMVAVVCTVAYTVYIVLFTKSNFKEKIKYIVILWISYIFVVVIVSSALQVANITQYPLWEGGEPKITNVLKGTNVDSMGMWNEEDAEFIDSNIYDRTLLVDLCKKEINTRFSEKGLLNSVVFYVQKFISQWTSGDCGGTMWAVSKQCNNSFADNISVYNSKPFQLFLLGLYFLSLICAFKDKNPKTTLLWIFLIGYFLLFSITENQARYSFVIIWVNIITASIASGNIFNKI